MILSVHEPGQPARVVDVPIADGGVVVIGRHPHCDVVLTDAKVSSRHCQLEQDGATCYLSDLGSRNGIQLGDMALTVARRPLTAGDIFTLGRTRITFHPAGAQATIISELPSQVSVGRDAARTGRSIRPTDGEVRAPTAADLAMGERRRAPRPIPIPIEISLPPPTALAVGPAADAHRTAAYQSPTPRPDHPADPPYRAVLRRLGGPLEARIFELRDGLNVIGRDEGNHLVVSRGRLPASYARLVVDGLHATISPLDAERRLYLDGAPLRAPRALRPGDLLRIGRTAFEFGRGAAEVPARPSEPCFVVDGVVHARTTLTVGRRADCDVVVPGDDVAEEHLALTLEADGRVTLSDRGYYGVWLNGRRVIETELDDGDRIGFGRRGLRVALDGPSCRLTLTDAGDRPGDPSLELFVTGPVGDSTGSLAGGPRSGPRSGALSHPPLAATPPTGGLVAGLGGGLTGGQDTETTLETGPPVPAPRNLFHWAPPGDVRRSPWGALLVVCGLLMGAAGLATLATAGEPLVRRPLAPSHAGPAFVEAAGGARCGACHTTGAADGITVDATACRACHADHAPRPAHTALDGTDDCLACHYEHAPPPDLAAGNPPTRVGCVTGACHPGPRHARFDAATAGPLTLDAPPIATLGAERMLGLDPPAIHALHGHIEGRCRGCHATAEGAEAPPAAVAASCVRCHDGDALTAGDCRTCHTEHGPFAASPPALAAPVSPPSGDFGLGLALLGPVLLLVGVRVSRRPRPEEPARVAIDPKQEIHIAESLCVGSESCVKACPYEVLRLVTGPDGRRIAKVVNFESCNECNTCVEVCEPKALTRRLPGTPVPMVARPFVDTHYQTTLPGLYLIGQAAGVSFVRNAVNLGARTIRHIVHVGLPRGDFDCDVAIVGAGPAGLSAALTAARHGLRAIVLEKGADFAQTIRGFHDGKPVQNQPAAVHKIGALWIDRDTHREELLDRWQQQLAGERLDLRYHSPVLDVRPLGADAGFTLTLAPAPGADAPRALTAARVILAIGGGEPRTLDVPGADRPKVRTACRRPADHDGEHIMIIGGGNSALEVAIACAEANGGSNTVRLVYRQDSFARASKRRRDQIDALVAADRLTVHFETDPTAIGADTVELHTTGRPPFSVPNTWVYTMLGKVEPTRWLVSLGIELIDRPQDWAPGRSDDLSFLEMKGSP